MESGFYFDTERNQVVPVDKLIEAATVREKPARANNYGRENSETYLYSTISSKSRTESNRSKQGTGKSDAFSEHSEETKKLFTDLQRVFRFQKDSCKNIYDYFVVLVESRRRGSRNDFEKAVDSLYADYILGPNSNFHKWYEFVYGKDALPQWAYGSLGDKILQIALYLLIWGESGNIRFMPELICFLFSIMGDYYYGTTSEETSVTRPFLEHAITPIYKYYYAQLTSGADHSKVIGYDDINQCFWNKSFVYTLPVKDVGPLKAIAAQHQYAYFDRVEWHLCLVKTYYEKRTWFHIVTNFHRVLVMHLSVYWYYLIFNSRQLYSFMFSAVNGGDPPLYALLLTLSFAGGIACLITIAALIGEAIFMPRTSPVATPIVGRMGMTILAFLANVLPQTLLFALDPEILHTRIGTLIAVGQFGFSLLIVLYYSTQPLKHLYTRAKDDPFTSNILPLPRSSQTASVVLWTLVFVSKFLESYYFLTLSVRDPIRELFNLRINNCNEDAWLGKWFCENHGKILTGLLVLTHCVLFFLDTYLWYILYNSLFSTARSFMLGMSQWIPWRNVFYELPRRFTDKLLLNNVNTDSDVDITGFAIIWNEIILSMYREHILSFEHVEKLKYEMVNEMTLRGPSIFSKRKSNFFKKSVFNRSTEAKRRLRFFAKSMSCPIPDQTPISEMAMFSVLIPHFKEKIILSIKDIVKGENDITHVILLEYLKLLYADDWKTFIQETGSIYQVEDEKINTASVVDDSGSGAMFNLPYSFAGFKTDTPEYTLRTRIWASLRTQTLYRTIAGFMKYKNAISILYRYETGCSAEQASEMALSKFRIVCSMQRMSVFTKEEIEDRDYLITLFPNLQIAYIEEEYDPMSGENIYYSTLIDGYCDTNEDGKWKPRYRIRLPGNPIIGDGKSDNQNHALIFTRGEYLQLIDANQDSYLEECLKIKSVLNEFENDYPRRPGMATPNGPVAIVGSREHVFSENTGVLGDIAAGKEQVFGTFFARSLSYLGGKLHYGHPDFVNTIFVTTRGGVSKAQKGLHLSEDVFVGMNSILRGGRIKHCEYTQCGKGRDLGFGSILNFVTKISAGMGEQTLSREYFYLCSNLPLDRFLSFYYAHPGHYLNNACIILSITLFMAFILNLAVLVDSSDICDEAVTRPLDNCANIMPVIRWLRRSVLSIFVVSTASFFPLFIEDINEKNFIASAKRILKHMITGAPMFEIFVCKVYSGSLINDLYAGGARYIATGRGMAVTRVPFSNLYAKFAPESFYFSFVCLLILMFATSTMWDPLLIYFWFTISSLLLSPFIFNPNQFSWNDFIVDYKNYWKWLTGNRIGRNIDSWISYSYNSHLKGARSVSSSYVSKVKEFLSVILQLCWTLLILIPYIFLNSRSSSAFETNTMQFVVMRILILSALPIGLNATWVLLLCIFSSSISPFVGTTTGFAKVVRSIGHGLGILSHVISFGIMCILQKWDIQSIIITLLTAAMLESMLLSIMALFDFSSEGNAEKSSLAWWSGQWFREKFTFKLVIDSCFEFIHKVLELSWFCSDFVLGHLLLFFQIPILIIPNINKVHSFMLFWKKAGYQIRPLLFSRKIKRNRRRIKRIYSFIFILMLALFVVLFFSPLAIDKVFHLHIENTMPKNIRILFHTGPLLYIHKGSQAFKSLHHKSM
ncbi:HHL071Wp [Eremothecium sinecaudum]|uniref:1,3-beta-glucan synthase n=1 Tax=Eremothecium sinecaudum TaxID=45286 RepID=A0A0X8HWB8_9SACH|nr:HHL071Wp [Eremothecium sinecaudum]AMD22699.1 HHL071Wp [Eremothecium sinecaudum]